MNKKNNASLHIALSTGDKKLAEWLLANGADVNAKDSDGDTLLHIAVISGDQKLAAWLLANGAVVDVGDLNNNTPLHLAVSKGHKKLVEWLLANGADVNARNSERDTPLHIAMLRDDQESAEFLLANEADVNAANAEGDTLLSRAVSRGQKELAAWLISNGANMSVMSKLNNTPLCIAVSIENKAFTLFVISVMISHNPDQKKPNSIQDKTEFSDYWDQTVAKCNELLSLKKFTFIDKSLFGFYNANDITTLASMFRNESRNKEIQEKITSEQFIKEHPLCAEKMQKKIKKGLERVKLLNRSVPVFCSAQSPCPLPYELWEKTLAYFPNTILQGFFKAKSSSGADKQNLVMDEQRQHELN